MRPGRAKWVARSRRNMPRATYGRHRGRPKGCRQRHHCGGSR